MKNKILSILICCLLTSCASLNPNISYTELLQNRSVFAKTVEEKSVETNCKVNSSTEFKSHVLHNNLWGKKRLKNDSAMLCTFQSENYFGWKWQMPKNAKGVIGYPAIRVGANAWNSTKKINGFPIQLDSIQKLAVNYETEIHVKHQKYNLAFDLWLSSDFQSSKESITTEIMIWEDYFDFKSFGKKVDKIETEFGTYEVMKGYLQNAEFGQNWQYFAFVRIEKRNSGFVDVQFLINYLIENHLVNPSEFLTSVEFGNEIGNSSGFTLVKEFDLKLND